MPRNRVTPGSNNLIRYISHRRHVEEEVQRQLHRQVLVAEFGTRALMEADLDVLMNEAVRLAAVELKVDYAKVLELLPDGHHLLLRAGVGWPDGWVGHIVVDGGLDSQAGYTLQTNVPVIVSDLRRERRFRGPPLLRKCDVISGLSVIIHGYNASFGVLGAHTRTQRTFTETDVHFFQSIANVLAAAIQRKGAEEATGESEARFRTLADNIAQLAWMADASGWIFWYNQRWFDYTGTTLPQMQGWGWQRVHHPDHVERVTSRFRHYLQTGEDWEDTFPLRGKDGSYRWFLSRAVPIRDDQGNILRWFGTNTDITERKAAETELAALRDRLTAELRGMVRLHELSARLVQRGNLQSLLPEVVDAAISITGADMGNLQLVDPVTGALQIEAQRGFERPFLDFFNRVPEGQAACGTALQRAECVVVEDVEKSPLFVGTPALAVMLAAGAHAAQSTPLITRSGRVLGMLSTHYRAPCCPTTRDLRLLELLARQATDLIEKAQAEIALQEAKQQLAEANAALESRVQERTASLQQAIAQMEEFSYSVSHDLRAPLRAIQGYSKILIEDHQRQLDPEGRAFLERIAQSGARMDRLIQDVLTYSRVSRREIQFQTIHLDKLVREIVQHLASIPPSADIMICGTLLDVTGHEPSLSQAISNLLNNAAKFVEPTVAPRIRIRTEPCDGQVRLWVEDNGIGIKPEFQHRLFGMFERIDPDSKFEGTGIGLAIVRKAVERMNGRVGVESDGIQGSRFWIELPAAEAAGAPG
jgi:PAS domain S-box-containing protein